MQPVADQIIVFIMLVILGSLIGVLFEIYRVLRRVHGLKKWGTNLGDALFWILTTSITYIFLLTCLWGEVRVYVFISMLVGFILYKRYLSSFMRQRIFEIYSLLSRIVIVMVNIMIISIKKLISIFFIPVGVLVAIVQGIRKCLKKIKSSSVSIIKRMKYKRHPPKDPPSEKFYF
jgi:spore cortex biosynthesis protein YabQ